MAKRKPAPGPRNPVVREAAILRKSGPHQRGTGAKRLRAKQDLRRQLQQRDDLRSFSLVA